MSSVAPNGIFYRVNGSRALTDPGLVSDIGIDGTRQGWADVRDFRDS